MALSALCWVNVAVSRVELVGWRQHSLLEEDLSDADVEPIPLRWRAALCTTFLSLLWGLGVAIQEGLGSDIFQTFLDQFRVSKQRIEGIDVRANCGFQGREGGMVLGRISEESLPPQSVELHSPFGICRCWCHFVCLYVCQTVSRRCDWKEFANPTHRCCVTSGSNWLRQKSILQRRLLSKQWARKKSLVALGMSVLAARKRSPACDGREIFRVARYHHVPIAARHRPLIIDCLRNQSLYQ